MFKQAVFEQVSQRGSCVCLGIDPHFGSLPSFMKNEVETNGPIETLRKFSTALINAASGKLPAVKFQMAFYETFGWEGVKVLEESLVKAKENGLLTILDAKRGDISSTMRAYGSMAFDKMDADCLTVTPYMGYDVVKPLVPWLKNGKGIYLVWVSSNPTGATIQENVLKSTNETMASELLSVFSKKIESDEIQESVGLVFGATKFDKIPAALVEKASKYPLLLPGVGPQGGVVSENLKKTLASKYHLLPMSRGLAGVGDKKAEAELNLLNDWESYQLFVRAKITSLNY